jgi:hypothetical protein
MTTKRTEIVISKIDYYTWKIGAIVLLFLLLFYIYFSQTHNKFANPSGYVEAFLNTRDKGICLIRFPSECPTVALICENDINKLKEEK